jgi:hypothetical protein
MGSSASPVLAGTGMKAVEEEYVARIWLAAAQWLL